MFADEKGLTLSPAPSPYRSRPLLPAVETRLVRFHLYWQSLSYDNNDDDDGCYDHYPITKMMMILVATIIII